MGATKKGRRCIVARGWCSVVVVVVVEDGGGGGFLLVMVCGWEWPSRVSIGWRVGGVCLLRAELLGGIETCLLTFCAVSIVSTCDLRGMFEPIDTFIGSSYTVMRERLRSYTFLMMMLYYVVQDTDAIECLQVYPLCSYACGIRL